MCVHKVELAFEEYLPWPVYMIQIICIICWVSWREFLCREQNGQIKTICWSKGTFSIQVEISLQFILI